MADWKRECLKLLVAAQQSILPDGSNEQLKLGVNHISKLLAESSKHPNFVNGYNGSLDDLVKDIGVMTYDQVSALIEKLSNEIKQQAEADLGRGRKKLAKELYETALHLLNAKESMDRAWEICKPYM